MGDGLRLLALHRPVEIDLGLAEIAAAGRQHFSNEPVVRQILPDTGSNPTVICLHGVGPEVDGKLRLDPQQIAPLHGPVVGELVSLQQAIDQGPAFVGVFIFQELDHLFRRGERADHVEVDASQEHAVGAHLGRGQAQFLQPAQNQLIDSAPGSRIGRAFKRPQRRLCFGRIGQGCGQDDKDNREFLHGNSSKKRTYMDALTGPPGACASRELFYANQKAPAALTAGILMGAEPREASILSGQARCYSFPDLMGACIAGNAPCRNREASALSFRSDSSWRYTMCPAGYSTAVRWSAREAFRPRWLRV